VRAVVNRFALHAAALRMAIEATLLPWAIEESDAGITACMRRWVQQRGNIDSAGEVARAVREVERELVASLNDRFIHIHKKGRGGWTPVTEVDEFRQKTPERFDGYVKPDRILIRPQAFRRYCNGSDPGDIARHLKQQRVLIADEDGVSKSEQVIGGTDRFYVWSRASLIF
jgi:hypothetical protein